MEMKDVGKTTMLFFLAIDKKSVNKKRNDDGDKPKRRRCRERILFFEFASICGGVS